MAKREYVGRTDLVDPNNLFTPKVYADHELKDFHTKIQRFWDEPREVSLPNGMSGTAQKFRHQDLHVSFGAARKVEHGKKHIYQYDGERYEVFNNLWKQYEDWQRKQDWIDNKNLEALVQQEANGVPF